MTKIETVVRRNYGSRFFLQLTLGVGLAVSLAPGAASAVTSSKIPMPSLPKGPAPFTMYRYTTAAKGICLVPTEDAPKDILKRNGISVSGKPSANEVRALSKGINQIQTLLGRPLPRGWQGTYKFIDTPSRTHWNQGATAINVRRPRGTDGGANIARLMHELGHRVGNAGEYERYRRYTAGARCSITGYAKSKFNEQFAEVFSSFVTYPDLLKAKCPKAYSFFTQKLFSNSRGKIASCESPPDAPGKAKTTEHSRIASESPARTKRSSSIK